MEGDFHTPRRSPAPVLGNHSLSSIYTGLGYSCGLELNTSAALCWGWPESGSENALGQGSLALGGIVDRDGNSLNVSTPGYVVGDHTFSSLALGAGTTLGVLSDDGSNDSNDSSNGGGVNHTSGTRSSLPAAAVAGITAAAAAAAAALLAGSVLLLLRWRNRRIRARSTASPASWRSSIDPMVQERPPEGAAWVLETLCCVHCQRNSCPLALSFTSCAHAWFDCFPLDVHLSDPHFCPMQQPQPAFRTRVLCRHACSFHLEQHAGGCNERRNEQQCHHQHCTVPASHSDLATALGLLHRSGLSWAAHRARRGQLWQGEAGWALPDNGGMHTMQCHALCQQTCGLHFTIHVQCNPLSLLRSRRCIAGGWA